MLLHGKKEPDVKVTSLGQALLQAAARSKVLIARLQRRHGFALHHLASDTSLNTCIHWGFLRLTMRANHSEPSAALGQEQSGPAAVQAAGLSSSATTGNTRSEHWMGLEYSMGWAFRTLDRAGTFYGMGIIAVATPETKHKAIRREVTATLQRGLTISKVPMRYFDDPVVDLQFGLCGAA